MTKVGNQGQVSRHLAGRFLTAGNHLHVLEDYHGLLSRHLNEGPLDTDSFKKIHELYNSQYLHVANQQEIEDGKHPDILPEAKLDPKPSRRPSSFEYQHQGSERPDFIDFHEGVPHFNGVPTTHAHVHSLMNNVQNGLGVIRYKKDKGSEIQKMESVLDFLMKADSPDLSGVFSKLRELVKDGHLDPEHERVLANHVYRDPMIPEVGNKFAYSDFLARPKPGVHIMLDGNSFKSVNDRYGHAMGDEAIKAMGRAVRSAADSVGQDKAKVWRIGGDEMAVHVPTHEHAASFARALRSNLEAIAPIGGSHRLSMSMGFGSNPEEADKALYHAKSQKYTPDTAGLDEAQRKAIYPKGTEPSFAHSLVPGFEGPIPLDQGQLNLKPIPPPPVKDNPRLAQSPLPVGPSTPGPSRVSSAVK